MSLYIKYKLGEAVLAGNVVPSIGKVLYYVIYEEQTDLIITDISIIVILHFYYPCYRWLAIVA